MPAHYCTITDVNALVPQQPYTSDSVPDEGSVTQFIVDCAQELDAVLDTLGYQIPVVTGTIALNQLRRANAWGALGIAQDARMTSVYRDDTMGGQRNVWTQRYEAFKKALQDPKNPYRLTDAPTNGNQVVKPVGQLQSSTVNTPDLSDYPTNPPFSIGMKF